MGDETNSLGGVLRTTIEPRYQVVPESQCVSLVGSERSFDMTLQKDADVTLWCGKLVALFEPFSC
jgi:hypothetical protein